MGDTQSLFLNPSLSVRVIFHAASCEPAAAPPIPVQCWGPAGGKGAAWGLPASELGGASKGSAEAPAAGPGPCAPAARLWGPALTVGLLATVPIFSAATNQRLENLPFVCCCSQMEN